MKFKQGKFVTRLSLIVLIALLAASTTAAVLPVGQPEYDFLYEQNLRRDIQTSGYSNYQISPYPATHFAGRLGPFERWQQSDKNELHCFVFGAEEFRAIKNSRGAGFESIRTGFTGQPFSNLSIYTDIVLDEELAKDDDYTGKKWRGFAGDVDQAFVSYHRNRTSVMVGRFGARWGRHRSLLFSPEQKLDGLGYSLGWGRATASYRLGALDGLNPQADLVDQFEPRYIAAHRLDFHFSRELRIGLFETVVFGGPGRQLDFGYLNPLIFYHGAQLNDNQNDNTVVGFDFDFNLANRIEIYGQLAVDDFQLDSETQGDNEPNQLGIEFGSYGIDLILGFDVHLEYERVNNWTFNQMLKRNRYLNDGQPLGDILGNDYDLISLHLIRWHAGKLRSSINLSHYRQGEGRIDAEWTAPWLEIDTDYSEPFPTGTVQKQSTLSIGLRGFLTEFVFIDCEAGVDWTSNLTHQAGDDVTRPFIRLYLSGFLLSSLNLD